MICLVFVVGASWPNETQPRECRIVGFPVVPSGVEHSCIIEFSSTTFFVRFVVFVGWCRAPLDTAVDVSPPLPSWRT